MFFILVIHKYTVEALLLHLLSYISLYSTAIRQLKDGGRCRTRHGHTSMQVQCMYTDKIGKEGDTHL